MVQSTSSIPAVPAERSVVSNMKDQMVERTHAVRSVVNNTGGAALELIQSLPNLASDASESSLDLRG